MKNTTKQVVILDNFQSPYIHQAILILKEYNPELEGKIIEEAEKIVSGYLHHPQEIKEENKKRVAPFLISFAFSIGLAFVLSHII